MQNLNLTVLNTDQFNRSLLHGTAVHPEIHSTYPALLWYQRLSNPLYVAASIILQRSKEQILDMTEGELSWTRSLFKVVPDVRLYLPVGGSRGTQQVASGRCITCASTWGLQYKPGIAVVSDGYMAGTYNATVYKEDGESPYAPIDGFESWPLGSNDAQLLKERCVTVLHELTGGRGLSKLQEPLIKLLSDELGINNSGRPVLLHEALGRQLEEIGEPVADTHWSVLMAPDLVRQYLGR